jgi:predicted PurR-regulated permease PerM
LLIFVGLVATAIGATLSVVATWIAYLASSDERVSKRIENLRELQQIAKEVEAQAAVRTDRGNAEPQAGVVSGLGDASKAFLEGLATFAKSLSGLSTAVQMYLFSFLFLVVGLVAASVAAYA